MTTLAKQIEVDKRLAALERHVAVLLEDVARLTRVMERAVLPRGPGRPPKEDKAA